MYRLLVFDIDGTLLSDDRSLPQAVAHALAAARSHGFGVTLATGRELSEAEPVIRQVRPNAPVVGCNGALVYDPNTRRILWEAPISRGTALRLAGRLDELGWHYGVCGRDRIVVGRRHAWRLRLGPWRRLRNWTGLVYYVRWLWEWRRYVNLEVVPDVSRFLDTWDEPVMNFFVWEPAESVVRHLGPLAKEVSVDPVSPRSVHIMAPGVDKGTGVEVLAGLLGIGMDGVVVCGDQYNDLSMLRRAGLAVAVGNAPPEVQRQAAWVVPSNRENGAALLIHRLIRMTARSAEPAAADRSGAAD
ncbi:HAD family hydrolase [Caldinitratiruptor microaerophilus]|uniref:Haloacid dehalogenase n=1 Tax=Caldinitratiruptor microaerophilus TaxID=671077 RepID=A0AA35G7T6_9FIRM|nr:HAD family hydrolase [Caldinitratiruptor microaerophilus]BDG59673.1 haloacid dehalogenase [Caldinitratiruptor microaerophilus]